MRWIKKLLRITLVFLFVIVCLLIIRNCQEDKTCQGTEQLELLRRYLRISDQHKGNDLLLIHGSIDESEMPCLVSAIKSTNAKKRRRGAELLVLTRSKPDSTLVLDTQKQVLQSTSDPAVFGILAKHLMDAPYQTDIKAVVSQQLPLIKQALVYRLEDDKEFESQVQSTALRAGVLVHMPDIDKELKNRLESNQADVLVVSLESLSASTVKTYLPRLKIILAQYESGQAYVGTRESVFLALIGALLRAQTPDAYEWVNQALEKNFKNYKQTEGARTELIAVRNYLFVSPHPEYVDYFFDIIKKEKKIKPLGFDLLITYAEKNIYPADSRLVQACLQVIKSNQLSTDLRKHFNDISEQQSCEQFFYFLDKGHYSMEEEHLIKHGKDAILLGEQWLVQHHNQ